MKLKKQKHPFEKCETGYHIGAVEILARWTGGIIEPEFRVENSIVFIPDIACYENGILKSIYEVVYTHPLTGRKLGLIEYWCYRNGTELTIFEVSADYILAQTNKPERIQTMECYIISL